jgi:hypothetical protein
MPERASAAFRLIVRVPETGHREFRARTGFLYARVRPRWNGPVDFSSKNARILSVPTRLSAGLI